MTNFTELNKIESLSTFVEKKHDNEFKNKNMIYASDFHRVTDQSFKGDVKKLERFPFYIWISGYRCNAGIDFKITWSKDRKIGNYNP